MNRTKIFTIAATLTITNSTFANNTSPNRGGAIANYGTLTVANSTFSANIANNGNGITTSHRKQIGRDHLARFAISINLPTHSMPDNTARYWG